MSIPAYIDDGDFSVPKQNGANSFSLPFFSRGDGKSFEVRQRWRVASASFKAPTLMQKKTFTAGSGFNSTGQLQLLAGSLGVSYLVECSDPDDVGNGLVEYAVTYASLPKTRKEGTSIVYPMQFLSTSGNYDFTTPPPAPEVAELQYPMAAEVEYTYTINRPPPLLAPRVEVLFGRVFNFNSWGVFQLGQRVLAQDAEITLYKGTMYQQRAIYIRWPGNFQLSNASAVA